MTEYHARYGGMIYWHVERKNVCIYSQLKSCSSSEVAAMIEGLLRHCTDAEISSNHVDTHGASPPAPERSRPHQHPAAATDPR